MDMVFKKSFKVASVDYDRFSIQPTIFNNILWYGIAETKNDYYVGFYSLLDTSNKAEDILKIPKDHTIIDVNHPDIASLSWFSNGYYNLKEVNGVLTYIDMRYPLMNAKDPESSVFTFDVLKKKDRWDIAPFDGDPPSEDDFSNFIERIKGN